MKMLRFCLILMWFSAAVPAPAEGRGIAEGRLINRTDPAIVAGNTELEILELSSGMDIIKTAKTDARGMFRIEGLPETAPLMLRAVYKGANYHGMLRFETNGTARLDLDVYETTTSMKDIRVEAAKMAFQLEGDRLHAVETVVVVNGASPPRVYLNPEGNFRVSKAPGVLEPPKIRITAPGAEMPLTQSALESADGESYYSLYPLRPGRTMFEVHQALPYTDKKYVYEKKFFEDMPELSVGLIPHDMRLSGGGFKQIEDNAAENFAVYATGAVRAGDKVTWTFTDGTPVSASEYEDGRGETTIVAVDGLVGRNALTIGSMILAAFILALCFAVKRHTREYKS
jgi:hypothetical protein